MPCTLTNILDELLFILSYVMLENVTNCFLILPHLLPINLFYSYPWIIRIMYKVHINIDVGHELCNFEKRIWCCILFRKVWKVEIFRVELSEMIQKVWMNIVKIFRQRKWIRDSLSTNFVIFENKFGAAYFSEKFKKLNFLESNYLKCFRKLEIIS